jgi:aspartyl/asparaginyl-tRNA synthetase
MIKNLSFGQVELQGFIKNIRIKKNIIFIVMNDMFDEIQVTIVKDKTPELYELASTLTINSVIKINGELVKNESVKLGSKEIIPSEIEVVSVSPELPVDENSLIDQKIKYR